MKVEKTKLNDVLILTPKIFGDDRGFFMESFNEKEFLDVVGRDVKFVQDNHSKSAKGVLRGLHYQIENTQAKLVRVVKGKVLDVAVDLRANSSTFMQWIAVELSEENRKQLWIPEGFAHGFLSLSDHTEFLYKTNNYYSPADERTIKWDDNKLNISWPELDVEFTISDKDKNGTSFEDAEIFQ